MPIDRAKPLLTINDFRRKYGNEARTFDLVLQEFISRSPPFKGKDDLVVAIDKIMTDLTGALAWHPWEDDGKPVPGREQPKDS